MAKTLNFNKPLKPFLIIYALIIVAAVVLSLVFGVKMDINFKGGTEITYDYTYSEGTVADIDTAAVKALVKEKIGADCTVTKGSSVVGDTHTFTVALVNNKNITTEAQSDLTDALQEAYKDNGITYYSSNSVSPSLATAFFLKAIAAVLVVAVLVVIYVGFRFRKIGGVTAALTALLSVVLDVVVSYAACVIFRLQIDMNYIAVVLTILGYSLNDTIVVYDSVRENKKKMDSSSLYDIVNRSLTDVLARNIVTTVTTVLAVITIIVVSELYGLASLRTFAIPMVFGLISGCMSSLFISTPLWVCWRKKLDAKK